MHATFSLISEKYVLMFFGSGRNFSFLSAVTVVVSYDINTFAKLELKADSDRGMSV